MVIHITFFFMMDRLVYLEKSIETIGQYGCETDIFIHTNVPDLKMVNGNVSIIHHELGDEHPYYLTWKCRELLATQDGQYDVYMYMEDDLMIPNTAIQYWIRYHKILNNKNYNLGFFRIEIDEKGVEYVSDLIRPLSQSITLCGELFCVNDVNPYCAFWIYDRWEFARFVKSPYYDLTNIKGYGVRESSAIGLHGCLTRWYKTTLVLLDSPSRVSDACKIYHMPNNYVLGGNKYGILAFHRVFQPYIHIVFVLLGDKEEQKKMLESQYTKDHIKWTVFDKELPWDTSWVWVMEKGFTLSGTKCLLELYEVMKNHKVFVQLICTTKGSTEKMMRGSLFDVCNCFGWYPVLGNISRLLFSRDVFTVLYKKPLLEWAYWIWHLYSSMSVFVLEAQYVLGGALIPNPVVLDILLKNFRSDRPLGFPFFLCSDKKTTILHFMMENYVQEVLVDSNRYDERDFETLDKILCDPSIEIKLLKEWVHGVHTKICNYRRSMDALVILKTDRMSLR